MCEKLLGQRNRTSMLASCLNLSATISHKNRQIDKLPTHLIRTAYWTNTTCNKLRRWQEIFLWAMWLLCWASLGETGSGNRHVYNAVWLRDNCQCHLCHNVATRQRAIEFHRLTPASFDPMTVSATGDHQIEVMWADGHVSRSVKT